MLLCTDTDPHDTLYCIRLPHQVFASLFLVSVRKVINDQVLQMNTLIQLCFAWKLLTQYCLLGWTSFMNVHLYTPLLPQLLIGIGLDWIGLDLVDDCCSSHLHICFLAQYAAGWTVSYLYSKRSAWFGWIELMRVMTSTVEAGWGKGSNSLLGWKEDGHSSSNFVGREILIIFLSLVIEVGVPSVLVNVCATEIL